MERKVKEYDKSWSNVDMLYPSVKNLSIDDYLKLYHMFSEDVSGYHRNSVLTVSNSFYTTR